MSWQPSASNATLQQRAKILANIRAFFSARDVLEVEVPLLASSTVTDVNIESLSVKNNGAKGFLQTSPEYFMKRLLAAGSGAIYYLGKAFRADEAGRLHNPEFTMLEWYRPGFNDAQLIEELLALCMQLSPGVDARQVTYGELFYEACGLDPHTASDAELAQLARETLQLDWQNEARSLWLDLLFTHLVEARLPKGLVVIKDFPACQCALARLADNALGQSVAKRFELYWNGIELANGYWELLDPEEQARRFQKDISERKQQRKTAVEMDKKLLAALDHGLPDCAGVALGVDRLVMCLLARESLAEVLSFDRLRS